MAIAAVIDGATGRTVELRGLNLNFFQGHTLLSRAEPLFGFKSRGLTLKST